MRICFTVSTLSSGGAERVAAILCNAWAANGHHVTLIPTFSERVEVFYKLDPAVNLVFLADRTKQRSNVVLKQVSRLNALRKLLREEQPDVVVSFLTNVNIAVLMASAGLKAKTIVCERNDPYFEPAGRVIKIMRKITYAWADLVTVQTNELAQRFAKDNPSFNVEVTPNPLPAELMNIHKQEKQKDKLTIVGMGRLEPQKGFDMLIDAFASVKHKYENCELWIWGEGFLRKELEKRIETNGLTQSAFLPGRTSKAWQVLSEADVFVLSSQFEGMPNVMMEAMCIGIPVVAFNCPSGPADLSQGGTTAVLVEKNNIEKLAEGIGKLVGDHAWRAAIAEEGQRSIKENYSIGKILGIWDRLFNKLGISR